MSSPARSPSRRIRATDFFRSSHTHAIQANRDSSTSTEGQIPLSQSQPLLDVPQFEESALKKMTTKIPFLGRTRKKSTHSAKSGGVPSTSRGYESSDVVESTASKRDRRLSHPVSSPEPASSHPPLPIPAVPQLSLPSPSLGAKFAAHFGNGHPRSRMMTPSPRSSRTGPSDGSVSDTLSPPRDSLVDSVSSIASTSNPPPTPRASPTITVSPSPDSLDEFKDLFTLPRNKSTTPATRRMYSTPASEYRDKYHIGGSNTTLSASTPTNTASPVSRTPSTSRTEVPAPRESRGAAESVFSTRTPKVSKKRTLTGTRTTDDLTSADESTAEDSNGRYPNPTIDLAPLVIDIVSPPQVRKPTTSISRSRMRASSSAKENATLPPTIPLPSPPLSASQLLPLSPLGSATSQASNATLRRPRSNTNGSTDTPTPHVATFPVSTPSRSPRSSVDIARAATQSSDKENNFEMDAATPEQLKHALMARNQQYDELAVHFLEVTRLHIMEKAALEKKINMLEAEVQRKDKEIQGFTWMLNNRSGISSSGSGTGTGAASPASERTHRSQSIASSRLSSRMFHHADDSGAESHQTSGAESILGSGASESSHSPRIKKLRTPTLSESSHSLYRSSMSSQSAISSRSVPVPDVPRISTQDLANGTRSSVYSVQSSPTSSTSSLLPPGQSISMSSLSAIPESASSIPLQSKRIPPFTGHASGSERESDDRQRPNRISTSSSSSSSIATSAYSANLKRGRPPSIAQVLEKSPVMDDVLEKLRPSSGTTTAVATPNR